MKINSENLPRYLGYVSNTKRGIMYAKLSISKNNSIRFHWAHTFVIGESSWDNFNRMIDSQKVFPMSKEEFLVSQIIEG